jgi:hypothetical protein
MLLQRKRQTRSDQLRDLALSALSTALEDGRRTVRSANGLSGARAVAAGAALYTAGHAAVAGGRAVRNRFAPGQDDEEYDEPEAEEDEEPEEPVRRRRRSAASGRR